ncbi:glycosyltransferase family 2 protein [Streptomyces sp. NPDC087903]|uniref:glycosyltransferase family 2 protein n=1 Tax=Streptomyces sp. NPDC087903 TaxID=3365819 RepID=UPI00380B4314
MPVKVSVIVPVYNPGTYIEDCISSLLRQSLPPDEYEVIFVDDGSTDGSPARLDALAAENSRVTVVHQENSGWSGKPRNVGIAAAVGEYVMFVDNDDYLGDEALERMYDYAVTNGADVVVGKMAGRGRPVPVELFRQNHPHATVENAPLIDSLTPHKMFRREFLDKIELRFPEGRRRLEDHVFVTEAYLRADGVSVLSDYVCYYHVKRDDAGNAGFQRFDPVGYFKNLREALDVVEQYTQPGPLRDRLFRRWLRNEMVERMRGRRLLALPDDGYRRQLFEEIRGVVVERFGPGVAGGLPPTQQVIAALIAADRFDDLVAFATWEAGIAPTAAPLDVQWHGDALRIALSAEYASGGEPMTFPADGRATPLENPPKDAAAAGAWVVADTVAAFEKATVDLLLRERSSAAQYFQPVKFTRESVAAGADGRVRLVLHATATVDPAIAAGGAPLGGGLWDVFIRVKLGGWTKECRLGPVPRAGQTATSPAVAGGRVVLPYWTKPPGNLALDVDRATKRLGLTRLTAADVTVSGGLLRAPLPLHVPAETKVLVRLTAGSVIDVPGILSPAPDGSGAVLEAELPTADVRGSAWRVQLSVAPGADEPRFLTLPLVLRVRAGRILARRAAGASLARRLVRRTRRTLGTMLGKWTSGFTARKA